MPAFLLLQKFDCADLDDLHQLSAFYRQHGVLCNDPRKLVYDQRHGYDEQEEILRLLKEAAKKQESGAIGVDIIECARIAQKLYILPRVVESIAC